MRYPVLVSLLVWVVTFSAGCVMSQTGSNTAVTLRRDAATSLKQMTERSQQTLAEKESSSEIVQASFTQKADSDSQEFSSDSAEETGRPEWWDAAAKQTETENRAATESTLSANSMTTVATSPQTGSWKPKRGWRATQPR